MARLGKDRPMTHAPRFERLPNGHRIRCYDSGPRYVDRWTVLFEDFNPVRPYGPRQGLAMSDHPSHPQGFGQTIECPPLATWGPGARHRRVLFASLPPDAQRCVIEYAADVPLWRG